MLENAQENGITPCEMSEGVAKGNPGTTSVVDLVTTAKLEAANCNTEGQVHALATDSTNLQNDNEGERIVPKESGKSILDPTAESVLLSDHSNFAKSHLEHIEERLLNKTQALKALKSSLKPESKVTQHLFNHS